MANVKNSCKERTCIDEGFSTFERNNYFCGKLMVERDFWAETLYHSGKQRLHNLYLHGWGAVCGLRVKPHPNCPNIRVVVEPGLAIDCLGREILVPRDDEVELASYEVKNNNGSQKPEDLYLSLNYRECETEPVPLFLDDCSCGEASAPNRIREEYRVEVLTKDHFDEGELEGYLRDGISSPDSVTVDPDQTLDAFDGTVSVKTLAGSFKKTISAYGTKKIKKLMEDIEGSPAQVTFQYKGERFMMTTKNKGDVLILEESGKKPFFSAIGFPAINTDKGNKTIEQCPRCEGGHRIILAVIEGYKNVDDSSKHYLDPAHPDFKIPAYTIDNLSYRKTLPSVALLNRAFTYMMYKT